MPLTSAGENAADTSYVFAAAASLAPYLDTRALVVSKAKELLMMPRTVSTVPVGTAALPRERLQAGAPEGVTARLA